MKRHAVATEPGEEFVPDKIITLEQAAALGGAANAASLQALLDGKATVYRQMLWAEDVRRPKPMRDELDQLVTAFDDALTKLGQLDDRVRGALHAALEDMVGTRGSLTRGLAFTRTSMERIRDAARRAHAGLPRGDGRPSLEPLRWLVCELATVYEERAGGRAAYDQNRKAFTLDRAEWVQRAVRWIDAEVTAENLSTVLRDLRKPESK